MGFRGMIIVTHAIHLSASRKNLPSQPKHPETREGCLIFEPWKPDGASPIPLYVQIRDRLRRQILSGQLPIGARLPTQRRLAEQLAVNRSTIVAALNDLLAEDLLECRGKSGTTVKNNSVSLNAPPPPDWVSYIQSGNYQANKSMVRAINYYEHQDNMLCLSRPELAPELFGDDVMRLISQSCFTDAGKLGYEHQNGSPQLRGQLCAHLKKAGIQAVPDQVLIVSGALQAIYLIAVGLLHKGSTILTENPSWLYFVNIFQSAGMKLQGVPIDGHGLKLELLEKLHTQTRASILYTIPSIHNPTGVTMPDLKKRELIALCQERKLPIIEDDAYREFYFDADCPSPLKAYDRNDLVLYVGTASKVLFPGLRLGWIVGPKQVIDRLADIKTQVDTGASTLSQLAMSELLRTGLYETHLSCVRGALKLRRDLMLSLLNRYFTGIAQWNIPKGGIYIWLRIVRPVSMTRLFQRCIARGVLFNPETVYSPRPGSHIRLSYAQLTPADMEKALNILSDAIRQDDLPAEQP